MKTVHGEKFRIGDRVEQSHLYPGPWVVVGERDADGEWAVARCASWDAMNLPTNTGSINEEATLLSRPLYPEPGQVVVALDAEEQDAIEWAYRRAAKMYGESAQISLTLMHVLARAREQSS